MDVTARLITTRAPKDPEGQVLVLHGGGARRDSTMVSPTQLSVLRMVPIAHRIAREGRGRLAVVRLLNSVRGWDTRHTPVDDVRWALQELRDARGASLPTCLVGHSLGGRAALLAGDQPSVRSVVALNPWVQTTDRVDLGGRPTLVVHGTDDRIADPRRSEALAKHLARTAPVGYLRVTGGRHAMLKHRARFEGAAADFARATLLGTEVTGPVAELLDGETVVTV
ncbi:MAG: alpha/beta hydrolase [Marmoricola sp.]|nr:alpha/beta hydrolase [Marmoricola sp.]